MARSFSRTGIRRTKTGSQRAQPLPARETPVRLAARLTYPRDWRLNPKVGTRQSLTRRGAGSPSLEVFMGRRVSPSQIFAF